MGLLDYLTQQGQAAKQSALNLWNTATNPQQWTPQALASAQQGLLSNLHNNPSSLLGAGTMEDVGQFVRPYIFDAQGFHLPQASMDRITQAAGTVGHDGVIFKNVLGGGEIHQPTVHAATLQILTGKP